MTKSELANRKALPKFLLFDPRRCRLIGGVIGATAASAAIGGLGPAVWRYGGRGRILRYAHRPMADGGVGSRHAGGLHSDVPAAPRRCWHAWDGEDEDTSSVIDGKLSAVLWASERQPHRSRIFLIAAIVFRRLCVVRQLGKHDSHLHWHCGVPSPFWWNPS